MWAPDSRKYLLLLVALLLLSSGYSWADGVTLTESEYSELSKLLKEQETTLIQQEQTISELQTELTTLERLSKMQAETIQTLSQLIAELRTSLSKRGNAGIDAGIVFDGELGVYLGFSFRF